jgi:hypothetical protein
VYLMDLRTDCGQVGTPGTFTSSGTVRYSVDKLGWPKFLEIKRSRWKGKLEKDSPITQFLHANVVEGGEFCSVAAVSFLLRYYTLCGVEQGPLFRQFTVDDKSGKKVPQMASFEKKNCKVGSGSATTSKWYASKETVTDQAGFTVYDGDGNPKEKWGGGCSLSEGPFERD